MSFCAMRQFVIFLLACLLVAIVFTTREYVSFMASLDDGQHVRTGTIRGNTPRQHPKGDSNFLLPDLSPLKTPADERG